ncbi:MAG: radical SAM protein [Syntrophobacteraceae bacterium]
MKVILNALPPARIDTPSAALSILKSFLEHNGIQAAVIYWNVLLDRLPPPFERNTDEIHYDLLPYLYRIAEDRGDDIAQSRANAVVKAQLPLRDLLNDNSDYLSGTKEAMDAIVAEEFAKLPDGESLLFGIPCKYEQWIPGIVLAGYVKEYFPGAGIVLGGLRNRDKAEAVMSTCDLFDFAVWGEGETPLLELCRRLDGHANGLASVPRLVYRKDGSLLASGTETGRFFDMNGGILPDYNDYFDYRAASGRKDLPVILPLESSRGCMWNACRFCVYGEGYENRKKDPGVLRREIEHLVDRYGARHFAFMDNDIVAADTSRLETILDDLIALRRDHGIEMMAEIVHKNLPASLLEKFPRAGFGRIHFGYEALSDRLLAGMKKRTNFSDNLFLVKLAGRYGIDLPSANVICGAVGEADRDILESIDNLHFLRFHLGGKLFRHNPIPLQLARHSKFYDMVEKSDLVKWGENKIFRLMPDRMVEGIDRFSLFDFSAPRNFLWDLFEKINAFYCGHTYSYSISEREDGILYREFFDGERVVELAVRGAAARILRETDSKILDLPDLLAALRDHGEEEDEKSVRAALDRLREKHLVYFGDGCRAIVSVVDLAATGGCPPSGEGAR